MKHIEMLEQMFKMQNQLNIHTGGENWKELNFPWSRACWCEAAEIMGWLNWKWWKKQEINIEQIKLELVDIWHFILSKILSENYHESINNKILKYMIVDSEECNNNFIKQKSIEKLVEDFIEETINPVDWNIPEFFILCYRVDLSFEELYKLYIGKNILNKFRQDNGYKYMEYNKIWFGKEDNDFLMDYLKTLDSFDNMEENIYNYLKEKYNEVLVDPKRTNELLNRSYDWSTSVVYDPRDPEACFKK